MNTFDPPITHSSPTMLYTKSAALRILSPLATKIESVQLIRNTVQVTYRTANGRCSTFLSRKVFKRDFVEFRKEGAKTLISRQLRDGLYEVTSAKGGTYLVALADEVVACECEDYLQQIEAFGGRACCKHSYHILNFRLGLNSLQDYLNFANTNNTQAA